jgi:hypothetical protein
MIKMFLLRNRLGISTGDNINELANRLPALMRGADAEYKVLLQQAVDFCNLDIAEVSSPDDNQVNFCKYVKQQMRAL